MIKIYKYKYKYINNIYTDDHLIEIDWYRRLTRKLYTNIGFQTSEQIQILNLEDFVKRLCLVELNKLELSVLRAKGIVND